MTKYIISVIEVEPLTLEGLPSDKETTIYKIECYSPAKALAMHDMLVANNKNDRISLTVEMTMNQTFINRKSIYDKS